MLVKRLWIYISQQNVIAFLFTSIVLLVSIFYFPPDIPTFILCPFKNLTSIDCPGCGLTRAFCALAKGQIHRAIHFHLLSPLLFGLTISWWISSFVQLLGCKKKIFYIPSLLRKHAAVGILILLVVIWILRLSGYQF